MKQIIITERTDAAITAYREECKAYREAAGGNRRKAKKSKEKRHESNVC